MKKLVYIVRHGQTEYNLLKKVQGSGVDSSLNDFGERQAQAFFEAYKAESFDKIYASKLQRSYQSVKQFEKLGYEIQRFEELNEISWGIHEGKSPSIKMKQNWTILQNAWDSGDYTAKIEGGESANDLAERLWEFVKSEIYGNSFNKILVCSHGRSIRALMCTLLNLPLSDMNKFEHHNLNLYLVEIDSNNKARLLKENCIEHLPKELIKDLSH